MERPFVNRSLELRRLTNYWDGSAPGFLALHGRRRVGKSRLLQHFFEHRLHVHLIGTAQTQTIQLADAAREVHRATGDEFLAHQGFASWQALLTYVGARAREQRFALILDEFSYFVQEAPELPSLLQRWWEDVGQRSQLILIIADSHATFIERLLRGDQPLFGRRTSEFQLLPFDYAHAAAFFPGYAPVERLRTYAVFGGMPAYLASCDPAASLEENILHRILAGDAYLRREPHYLLSQERSINDPTTYLSVLRAIASGQTQPNHIAQFAGFARTTDITVALERLRSIRLIERLIPVGSDPRGKVSRYVITDPLLSFWFTFVQPNDPLLDRGFAERVLDELLHAPGENLDRHISAPQGPWEQACLDYLWRAQRAGQVHVLFDQLGPWWEGRGRNESVEIDGVGLRHKRVVLLASCKWTNSFMKPGDLDDVRRAGGRIGATSDTPVFLFSRSGFDPNLVERAAKERVHLVTPADMFEPGIVAADPTI